MFMLNKISESESESENCMFSVIINGTKIVRVIHLTKKIDIWRYTKQSCALMYAINSMKE